MILVYCLSLFLFLVYSMTFFVLGAALIYISVLPNYHGILIHQKDERGTTMIFKGATDKGDKRLLSVWWADKLSREHRAGELKGLRTNVVFTGPRKGIWHLVHIKAPEQDRAASCA